MKSKFNFLMSLDLFLEKISRSLLVVAFFFMLVLTIVTITGRWFQLTILWIEPLVRHLVFLSAFLGGVLAIGSNGHIAIDILSKYLEQKKLHNWRLNISRILLAFSMIICLALFYASYLFLKMEIEFGQTSFLGIHTSLLVGIIPFGLGMMIFRYGIKLLQSLFAPEQVEFLK